MVMLFWFCTSFVVYTYIIYPLLIWRAAKKSEKKNATPAPPEAWPTVAVVVPVHNEAHHVLQKLNNLRLMDYPKDKISLTFVSDGSEDQTNELLEPQQDIQFIAYHPRQGKPTALNRAMEKQTASIIVFTDARQTLAKDSIKKLVTRLQDNGIGAVSGELCFRDSNDLTAQNVGLYWRYEKSIRQWESQVHSVAGATGALYAIRREDYFPLYEDALLDDFEIPIQILRIGRRVVLEPGAFVYDDAQSDPVLEKTRKIRTLTGNFQSFAHNKWLFSKRNPILWQFLSHKVFRLLVPYALVLALISNLFLLSHWFYCASATAQIGFYSMGLMALKSEQWRKFKLPNLAAVFLQLNYAAVLGLIKYRQQQISVKWDKTS